MQKIIPSRLKKGDKVMVIAPARGIKIIGQDCRQIARQRLESLGLEVVFAPNTIDENWDYLGSTTIEKRIEDIHLAFSDKNVGAILTIIGGANSNQLLPYLDYNLIKNNPKIFCGFSDITALHGAINAKTGLETYYGPHFSSLGMKHGCDYTFNHFIKMLMEDGQDDVKAAQVLGSFCGHFIDHADPEEDH
ncbi:MAG: LD-carboxypeptidase [Alphaproteobacteria bacterium]|nr:LD-carboxypeptidase [Alphaproteobacteria bacterium]